jgi:DNA-binding XRE family transcriptional regulator
MITRIREVRKAKGLTLEQVAALCQPPTTAQTIGRLETGTRTVSVNWVNRIAQALGVGSSELVALPGQSVVPVAALLGPEGARAPTRNLSFPPPVPADAMIGVQVSASIGDYRSGDEIWCRRIGPEEFASALNRDMLLRQADRPRRGPIAHPAAGRRQQTAGHQRSTLGRCRGPVGQTIIAKAQLHP